MCSSSPREAALRNAIFVGCLSETVSIALLTEERELTREPVIRRVVDQLAADEVLHAKLGWSYLVATWPTLDEAARARTRAYLPVAFGFLEAKMLDAYHRRRWPEVKAREVGIDLLNRASMVEAQPLRDLRAGVLGALYSLGPVRKTLMKAGLGVR